MYVEENLVFYKKKFEKQNDLFDFIADELEEKKYVTEEFRDAIKLREEKFPTGLQLSNMNLAIVHTESIYSTTDKLIILNLEESIEFKNIETLKPLQVDFIIGLILHDSEKHLEVLRKISQLLQDEDIIHSVKEASSREELTKIMQNYFNKKENIL